MKISRVLLAVLFFGTGVALAEDAPPPKKWKNATEASVVSANGNTKSSTYAGKNTFNYNWAKSAMEIIGAGLGSDSQGSVTAEKYMASEKLEHKISARNYMYEKGRWDKDRFAGIGNRYDTSVGLGRELLKSTVNDLVTELGVGYVNEQPTNAERDEYTSGRAYSKYILTLSPTSNFSQDAEYIHNFENSDAFRVNTETAITAAINTNFSLKASYTWRHVGEPPVGFHRNDTIVAVALIANYESSKLANSTNR